MTCNNLCNQCCDPCADPCKKKCGCYEPILDIDEMPDSVSILRYNINGLSTWYDYGNMIYQTQTDTRITADSVKRVLRYMAERHTDSISARELGSILHVADLGDVDISGVQNNSLFVYRKDNNCAQGCEGISNAWTAWNSTDNTADSLRTIMGFDKDGVPYSLLPPANSDQHYLLEWRGNNEVGYRQVEEVSKESITVTEGGRNYIYKVCVDPNTNELVYIKEEVQ